MFSTFLALVLAVVPTASAQELQTTAASDVEVVNAIGYLEEKLRAAQARSAQNARALKAALVRLTALEEAAKADTDASSTTPDPAISAALAAAAEAKDAYEAATAEYEALRAMLADAQASPAVVHNHVRVSPTPVNVIVDSKSEPTWTGYVGGAMVFAAPVPDVSGTMSGRAVAGVRPSVKIGESDTFRVALGAEASYENLGLGVRVGPELLIIGQSGEWGVGGAVAYACNGFNGSTCAAEYYGGLGRVTWSPGSGPVGALLFANVEFGGLNAVGYDEPAAAVRAVIGGALRFGKAVPDTVTVPQ